MVRLDLKILNSELRRLGEGPGHGHAVETPGAAFLKDTLSSARNPDDRFVLYLLLGGELRLDGNFETALEWAKVCFAEFGDIPSRNALAKAFLELGRNERAIDEFRAAYASALESNTLVNYIYGEFMRAATKLGNVQLIEDASKEFFITGT